MLAACALAPGPPARAQGADTSYDSPDLGANSAAPWNPARRVSTAEPWETALRLPGRIVSLPLVGAGRAAQAGAVWAEDHHVEARIARLLAEEAEWGVAAGPASLGDATGLGARLEYRPPPLRGHLAAEVSASTQHYNREAGTLGVGPLAVAYASDWRPRERYFGTGMDALRAQRSDYAAFAQSARLVLGNSWQPADPTREPWPPSNLVPDVLAPAAHPGRLQLAAWAGPREAAVSRGRDPRRVSFEVAHPAEAAGSLDRRIEQLAWGVGAALDRRAGTPHWSRGWRAALTGERFDGPARGLGFHSATTDARSFTRLQLRGETGVSFGRDPRTLRLAVHVVDQRLDRGGGAFLVSDLAALGGSELAGFDPGRFRDLDLAWGRLTYLFPLLKNLEFDLHGETGEVMPRLGAIRLGAFRSSFGAALRLRTEQSVVGMVGVDASYEQVRLRFALGGVQ